MTFGADACYCSRLFALLLLAAAVFMTRLDVSTSNAQPVNDDVANATVISSELTCGSFEAAATLAKQELWWKWQPRYAGETVFGMATGRATIALYHGETPESLQRIGFFGGNIFQSGWDCSNPRDYVAAKVIATDPATNYWIAVSGSATWTLAQRTFELVSSADRQRLTLGASATVQLQTINHESDHPIGSAELILGRTEYPGNRPIILTRTVETSTSAPHRFSWRPSAPGYWWLAARGTNSLGEARQTAPVLHEVSPANDDFARATVIPPEARFANFTFDYAAASLEPGEPPHSGESRNQSLWWKWRPSWSGPVELTTSHSQAYGVPLDVFTGKALTNLTRVAGNGRRRLGGFGFTARAGMTYRIRVFPYNASGTQRLKLQPYVPPVPPSPALPIYMRQTFQPHPSLLQYSAANRFQGSFWRGSRNASDIGQARRFGSYGSSSIVIIGTNSPPAIQKPVP